MIPWLTQELQSYVRDGNKMRYVFQVSIKYAVVCIHELPPLKLPPVWALLSCNWFPAVFSFWMERFLFGFLMNTSKYFQLTTSFLRVPVYDRIVLMISVGNMNKINSVKKIGFKYVPFTRDVVFIWATICQMYKYMLATLILLLLKHKYIDILR